MRGILTEVLYEGVVGDADVSSKCTYDLTYRYDGSKDDEQ
jgi:hypothetical protein